MRISGAQPGFRFLPDDDVIILYLLDKVTGNNSNPVFDCDLYDEEEAWKKLFVETGESELYFLTRLRKAKTKKGEIEGGGGRVDRTIGSKATWRSSKDYDIFSPDEKDKIPDEKDKIGSKRTFTYRLHQRPAGKKEAGDGFSMTEYRLDGIFASVPTDLVICSVRRKEDRASSSEIEIVDAGVPLANSWGLRPCGSTTTSLPAMGGMVFSC